MSQLENSVRERSNTGGVPFGRYVIRRRLGRGGMGEVFLADQLGPLGPVRPVALKRMLPQLAAEAAAARMFLEEMGLVAPLNHPSIATTYDFGEVDGVYFIAMEYVDGLTLHAILHAVESLSVPETVAILRPLAAALEYAHELDTPVVHRDVSPQNVIISLRGIVKLLDFGIARAEAAIAERPRGKIAYSPPEQLCGEPPDRRFDIWALGVVVYEALAGQKPFTDGDPREVLAAQMHRRYVRLAELRPELAAISDVVDRALAPEPALRFASARDFVEAFEYAAQCAPSSLDSLSALVARAGGARTFEDSADVTGTGVAVSVAPETVTEPPKARSGALVFGLVLAGLIAVAVVVTLAFDEPVESVESVAPVVTPPVEQEVATVAPEPVREEPPPVKQEAAKRPVKQRVPAKQEPALQEAPAEANGLGVLSVRTTPWAKVLLDGKPLGEGVVASKPVSAGKHTLLLQPGDDRYPPKRLEIDIRVGIATKVFVDFERDTVRVDPS